jgi:hypothetical protein
MIYFFAFLKKSANLLQNTKNFVNRLGSFQFSEPSKYFHKNKLFLSAFPLKLADFLPFVLISAHTLTKIYFNLHFLRLNFHFYPYSYFIALAGRKKT